MWPPSGYRIVDPVAEAVGKDRVVEVPSTTQLFGTEALGHPHFTCVM
jgi:hypothetical protein